MKYKYKSVIITLLIFFVASPAWAQSELRKANRHYEKFEYTLALEDYQKSIAKKQPTLETSQRMANAYRLTGRTEQAETWYAEALKNPGADPVNIFYYAEMLRANGRYSEAREQYKAYAAKAPADADKANKMIAVVDKAIQWLKRPPSAEVSLATGLNSPNADFSPTLYKGGIVFTSDRSSGLKNEKIYGWTGRPYLKLYASTKSGENTWSAPTPIPAAVNANYHNGPATVAADNNTLFFTRTKMVPKKGTRANNDPTHWVKEPQGGDFINRLEIFSAQQQGDQWVNVKPFPFNKVEEYSVGHPALSPDGKFLYFASDMPGGIGDTDIYYCEKLKDDTWSKPVNAGTVINTSGKEEFPAFAPDGTFYFSSDRHPGFGGLDIFSAKGQRADWSRVTNMYAPLNSSKDDYGIMLDATGRAGFFSSNRASKEGTSDIYTFRLLYKPTIIVVTALERKQDGKVKTKLVPLRDVRLNLTRQSPADSTIALTDVRGNYNFKVGKGFNYRIAGAKSGYLTQSRMVAVDTTSKSDTIRVRLTFDRNIANRAIVLENIYFDLDKYDIRPDAAAELDKLAQMLKDNPKIKIEMGSHCDSRESPLYNQQLSENRAKATVEYLITQGINRNRLTAKGYGESRPVNRCADGVSCSEEEHQQNRRTEFKIRK